MQRTLLYRSGILKPRLKTADHGALETFAAEDEFQRRILEGAAPEEAAQPGQGPTSPPPPRKACCSANDVVQAILDRRLTYGARLAGERGCMAVLVDVEEVRTLVRGADHRGFADCTLAERLGVAEA